MLILGLLIGGGVVLYFGTKAIKRWYRKGVAVVKDTTDTE